MARFFEGSKGPSHDELNRLFAQTGFARFDPSRSAAAGTVGKLKRVRGALMDGAEADPVAALAFVRGLTAMLKARGAFDPDSPQYAGEAIIGAARTAMNSVGWRLEDTGALHPTSIAGLVGRDLGDALEQYVRRIQTASDDEALTVGSAKELLEAAARHVLVEESGAYDERADFPTTMFRAATTLGTGVPTSKMIQDLDADPFRALEQALVLASIAVSRFRNREGTGHGHPRVSRATRRQGIVTAHAAAAVAYLLLHELTDD